uniref:AMP-binding domain-containing protein n=1 Tax=Steinernema glaseri TaxID=37863 RepID=A0A1I7YC23_9BILA
MTSPGQIVLTGTTGTHKDYWNLATGTHKAMLTLFPFFERLIHFARSTNEIRPPENSPAGRAIWVSSPLKRHKNALSWITLRSPKIILLPCLTMAPPLCSGENEINQLWGHFYTALGAM